MKWTTRGVLALGLFAVLLGMAPVQAQDETVENPKYKLWANFKPGMSSTYTETTKLSGAEKDNVPGGVDIKTVTYRLDSVTKDKAVVSTTVIEEEFLGSVESAPTRLHYPAKVKKANLDAALQEFGAKPGDEETIKVGDKDIKCKVLAGSSKKNGTTIEFKLCYSDEVPGGIVKRTRTTKDGDKVVAETMVMLTSFGEAKAGPKAEAQKFEK